MRLCVMAAWRAQLVMLAEPTLRLSSSCPDDLARLNQVFVFDDDMGVGGARIACARGASSCFVFARAMSELCM